MAASTETIAKMALLLGINLQLDLPAVCLLHLCLCGHASGHCTGDSVYGEKRISVEGEKEGEKIEYRVWNPFRCALHLLSCLLSAQHLLCFICLPATLPSLLTISPS